jgi:hypothetical protein
MHGEYIYNTICLILPNNNIDLALVHSRSSESIFRRRLAGMFSWPTHYTTLVPADSWLLANHDG